MRLLVDSHRKDIQSGRCGCLRTEQLSLGIEHDCLGKQCSYFEKNPVSSYLIFLENKKKYREQLRKEKQKKRAEANDLKAMQDEWQAFLDSVDSDMQIVRIENNNTN